MITTGGHTVSPGFRQLTAEFGGERPIYRPFSRLVPTSSQRRTQCGQCPQSRQVVGRHRQRQQLIHLGQAPYHHLTNRTDALAPTKALFDTFPPSLAHGVAAMACGAAVNGTATGTSGILCDRRGDLHFPACADKASRVVVLVGPHRHLTIRSANVCQHGRCHLTFGIAISSAGRTLTTRPCRLSVSTWPK